MRILFFIVHPGKYHLFKHTINTLKKNGYNVDVAIITKDVLGELVENEKWDYTNIFPEGRRSISRNKFLILITTLINFFRTIWRLYKFTYNKKYDLFVASDCLTIIGFIKRIPTLFFSDDDLKIVPEASILYSCANNTIAPECTDLGRFNKKKIPFKGYKELSYLHPKYFTPDYSKVAEFNPSGQKYYILRLVSLTASHDGGKKGISDNEVHKLIGLLEKYGKIFITSERELPESIEKYRIKIRSEDIAHALYYAEMFIGDSQTMTSEAAILGTPAIRFNDFVGRISVMEEKEYKYDLSYGFKTDEFERMYNKIKELLDIPDLKEQWQKKREKLIEDCIDVNEFMYNTIVNYNNK
jgi:uncharacterized protein